MWCNCQKVRARLSLASVLERGLQKGMILVSPSALSSLFSPTDRFSSSVPFVWLHRDGRTGDCMVECREAWAEWQKKAGGRGLGVKEREHYFHCLQPSMREETFWEDPSSLKVFDFSKGSWERKEEIEKTCIPNGRSDLDLGDVSISSLPWAA